MSLKHPRNWIADTFILAVALQLLEILSIRFITSRFNREFANIYSLPVSQLMPSISMACALGVALYVIFVRIRERRSLSELRLSESPFLVLGIATGAGAVILVMTILVVTGHALFEGFDDEHSMATAAVVFLGGVTYEELIFRGVIYRRVEESWGSLRAIIISGTIFAVSHSFNDGAGFLGMLCVGVAGGTIFGLAYTTSGSLWLPLGLHFGWNLTQAALDANVSGFSPRGIARFRLVGPEYMTGGRFGPEASLVTMAVGLAFAATMVWIAIRSKKWVRPA